LVTRTYCSSLIYCTDVWIYSNRVQILNKELYFRMFRIRPFLKAAAVLVLLLIVAAGGYYFYFDREHSSVPAPDLRNVKTIAGLDREFSEPFGIAVRDGVIYVSDGNAGKIFAIAEDSSVSLYAEGLHTPSAIAFD